jgi:GTP-binding protein LepA
VDLPAAEPERVKQQIEDVIGSMPPTRLISAKTGIGIDTVLEAIVTACRRPRATMRR